MACDRFVYWRKGKKRPLKRDLEAALIRYIGQGGTVRWNVDRYFVDLPGAPSDPFPFCPHPYEKRWFEVYLHRNAIDVITRQADELTNVIAAGFATLCARYWQGKQEDP
jgi:hypothetical protein